jgi:hypothetical protein
MPAECPLERWIKDVSDFMRTGKLPSGRGVNGARRTRIKSAQTGRFCARCNQLFTVMVTAG